MGAVIVEYEKSEKKWWKDVKERKLHEHRMKKKKIEEKEVKSGRASWNKTNYNDKWTCLAFCHLPFEYITLHNSMNIHVLSVYPHDLYFFFYHKNLSSTLSVSYIVASFFILNFFHSLLHMELNTKKLQPLKHAHGLIEIFNWYELM